MTRYHNLKCAVATATLAALIVVSFMSPALAQPKPDEALSHYVRTQDGAFAWEIKNTNTSRNGRYTAIELTSQVWQNITWKHELLIFEPPVVEYKNTALLFISGGSNGRTVGTGELLMGSALASLCKTPIALLRQVPNQPLFKGRYEDALIAHTFLSYVDSKDSSWPLLFPMVKSAVKAMDAVGEFHKQERDRAIEKFVVTGASKRGWTTWLTAAADKRVAAIAPMVIDTLNMPEQMPNQLKVWGKYSPQIQDYTRTGLVDILKTPIGKKLNSMIDPYSYRELFTMPKLIINGTNDPYWTLDALELYWNDLPDRKNALYLPNAGHGLEQNRSYATNGIAALVRHTATGAAMPSVENNISELGNGRIKIEVSATHTPISVSYWTAETDKSHDFRKSMWLKHQMTKDGEKYSAVLAAPPGGYAAILADLEFEELDLKFHLSSRIGQVLNKE